MRRAVVTGCSSGIGLAVTRALLADGWEVLGAARTEPLVVLGPSFRWVRCNVAVGAHVERLAATVGDRGTLDALIACAGSQHPVGPIRHSDPQQWSNAIGVNLLGAYRVVRALLPQLERSEDGRILLFSGGGAFSPRPNFSAYAAAKAGVVALMEALSGELPSNVTANCVAPGFVQTPIHAPTLEAGAHVVGAEEYSHALGPDDGQLARVVACVRHLLDAPTRGLTGKTVAAPWDSWKNVDPGNVAWFNASDVWTRTRVKSLKTPCPVRPIVMSAPARRSTRV